VALQLVKLTASTEQSEGGDSAWTAMQMLLEGASVGAAGPPQQDDEDADLPPPLLLQRVQSLNVGARPSQDACAPRRPRARRDRGC
jgi:hypothetical protein